MVRSSEVATGPGSAYSTSALFVAVGLFRASSVARGVASATDAGAADAAGAAAGFVSLTVVPAGGVAPAGGDDSVDPHPASARMQHVAARTLLSVIVSSP